MHSNSIGKKIFKTENFQQNNQRYFFQIKYLKKVMVHPQNFSIQQKYPTFILLIYH